MGDTNTAKTDSLKVLDPKRPIREADIAHPRSHVSFVPGRELMNCSKQRRFCLVRHRDFTRHLLAPSIDPQQHDNDGAHQRATREQ